jgi:hypothetical protein
MSKVTRFPTDSMTRRKNRLGRYSVPCRVSDRWLQFKPVSNVFEEGDVLWVDVMTDGGDRKRKICSLAITREDLEAALSRVRPTS